MKGHFDGKGLTCRKIQVKKRAQGCEDAIEPSAHAQADPANQRRTRGSGSERQAGARQARRPRINQNIAPLLNSAGLVGRVAGRSHNRITRAGQIDRLSGQALNLEIMKKSHDLKEEFDALPETLLVPTAEPFAALNPSRDEGGAARLKSNQQRRCTSRNP
jgi:hypothetical protein